MKETYNLEDKVFLDAGGNVTAIGTAQNNAEQQNAGAEPHSESIQGAESRPKTGARKDETTRPKREIVKTPYLKDFVEK